MKFTDKVPICPVCHKPKGVGVFINDKFSHIDETCDCVARRRRRNLRKREVILFAIGITYTTTGILLSEKQSRDDYLLASYILYVVLIIWAWRNFLPLKKKHEEVTYTKATKRVQED